MLPAAHVFSPLRRVLYATDFTGRARSALPYAAGLTRAYGAELYVAHVVEVAPWENCPELSLQQRIDATRQLDWMLKSPALADIRPRAILRHGGVAAEILNILEKQRVDLLVIASEGHRGLRRLLLGPIAARLARCAPCAVLTVGPRSYPRIGNALWLRRIVYATDTNPGAAAGIAYASSFARRNQARLTIVQAVRESMCDEMLLDAARAWLKRTAHGAEVVVEAGALDAAALRLSEQQDADLIMLGPGTAGLAQRVTQRASCPVMTVRPVLEMAPRSVTAPSA